MRGGLNEAILLGEARKAVETAEALKRKAAKLREDIDALEENATDILGRIEHALIRLEEANDE